MTNRIEVPAMIDCHVHLRDGSILDIVTKFTANRCDAAIVMPNLTPPITSIKQAHAYCKRIRKACGANSHFVPHMTVYLTDTISPLEIQRGYSANRPEDRAWMAAKLYPAGATTNSEEGVTSLKRIYPVLGVMEEIGMPLLVHGELLLYHNGSEVYILDREKEFIHELTLIISAFPKLKIVFEHITTEEAANFVQLLFEKGVSIAATITPHHLFITTNDIFRGGIRPDLYCLPIAKKEEDRAALRQAATSGLPCFFAGTDSAPHEMDKKYTACGCAGIFNAHAALELYAQVFEEESVLKRLADFTSGHARKFYGFEESQRRLTLIKRPWLVQRYYGNIVPFMNGEKLAWQIEEIAY